MGGWNAGITATISSDRRAIELRKRGWRFQPVQLFYITTDMFIVDAAFIDATMSENNSTADSDKGLLGRVGESLGFDIDRIKDELADNPHETDPMEQDRGPVVHPDDPEIVEQAVAQLVEQKQKRKAEQADVESHRNIEVEVDIGDPTVVLNAFATRLYETSEELVGYLYQNSLFDVGGPSLEADDEELITYIIEERTEDDRPAAFLGGAQPVRLNMAERADMTRDEAELVRHAHTIASEQNGYDRHLLLDDVIVVPLDAPPDNPYEKADR